MIFFYCKLSRKEHLKHKRVLTKGTKPSGLRYSQVLFAGSATDFALFVEEVKHTPQDGQQQDADDDDCNDDAIALWWSRRTRTRCRGFTQRDRLSEVRVRLWYRIEPAGPCIIPASAYSRQPFTEINERAACASFR